MSRQKLKPDPIFAAIAMHRAATAAFHATCGRKGRLAGAGAGSKVHDRAYRRNSSALYRVLTTDPTTMSGVAAVLRHVGSCDTRPHDCTSRLSDASVGANGGTTDWDRAVVQFPKRLAAVVVRLRKGGDRNKPRPKRINGK